MAGTLDFADIAAALATRFGALTPPTGQGAIRSSTHLLPENITDLPCVLVFPFRPDAGFSYDPYSRTGLLTWPVRFFFDRSPLPQRMGDLYQWLQSLYDVFPVSTSIDLGLGAYVRYATVTAAFITRFEYPTGTEYPVIQLDVLTHVGEPLS
jgi:hypothetical protein